MARIHFHNPAALAPFASMAEGMWEVQRDDRQHERAAALERIADACGERIADEHPFVVEIEDRDAEEAQAVLENCLDNSSGTKEGDDPEREDYLFEGDVTVEVGPA